MIPIVKVTKLDGNTGVAAPSSRGICAVIAPSSSGTANQPISVTKAGLALTTFGDGVLTEDAAYLLAQTGNPVVLVKGAASTAAAYSAVTLTGTGTSVVTAGATAPVNDFPVIVTVVVGGTRGTDGITYTYSLDGGLTTSAIQALGTATAIVIPNTGVTLNLAAGTLIAGDVIKVTTTGPKMSVSDISTALEALRTSSLAWEGVLIDGHDAAAATVSALDTWLAAREAEGKYRLFVVNARLKTAGESEAAYLTAMATAWNPVASIRGCVGADGGDLTSAVPGRGYTLKKPTALGLMARAMRNGFGADPARVSDGPLGGFGLPDAGGNPKNHDEALYPGLDALRLVTLRTFDRRNGTFITNANAISSAGSDFVWIQHLRTMNRACELAFDVLVGQLSRGVNTSPKKGPTGQVYIAEEDALRIEALVNQALNELRGQVQDLRFNLTRTDDIGSNGAAVLNGDVQLLALRYAKEFDVNASFVRSITASRAA